MAKFSNILTLIIDAIRGLKRKAPLIKKTNVTRRIIGITGMPGAGKSTASKILALMGAEALDADYFAHEALKKDTIKNKISLAFGDQIVDNKEINKKKLAEVVFSNPTKRKQLEDIIHPDVISEIKERISNLSEDTMIVLDVPLLHDSGLDKLCDTVIVITADRDVRLERVKVRGWSEQELTNRDKAIFSRIPHDNCVFIPNNSSPENLKKLLTKFIN